MIHFLQWFCEVVCSIGAAVVLIGYALLGLGFMIDALLGDDERKRKK